MLGLDFDGTIASIVPEPERAALSPQVLALLSELSRCLLRVVIISGRDTDFLASRVPLDQVSFVGNHGLEERQGSRSRLFPEAEMFVSAVERATAAISHSGALGIPGVIVEPKRAAVTVHYRNVSDPDSTGAFLANTLYPIARREGLELQPGRRNWELRPRLRINKGEVIRRVADATGPAAIVYMGDDRTDADAFLALKTMIGLKTVAVGVQSPEVPDQVFIDCDLMVEGVAGATQALAQLLDVCRNA